MGRLRGIIDSKRRYQRYLHNQGLSAPPADGRLDSRLHVPSAGPQGTILCSCAGSLPYSPAAFAAHIAGRPMLDTRDDVYVTGPLDPWAIERERRKVATPAPTEQLTDADGWLFESFENDLRQRMVRYLTGPKAGQVEHAPTFALPPAEPQRRAYIAHGTDPGMT